MSELIPGIRNTVRALILKNGSVLLQHKVYEDGSERYVLPGGAAEAGETLIESLQRECHEEIGCKVDVGELLYIADFFKPRKTVPPTRRHQVEFIFRCHVSETYVPQNGHRPDKHQKDVIWMNVAEVKHQPFFPGDMGVIIADNKQSPPCYLGVIE